MQIAFANPLYVARLGLAPFDYEIAEHIAKMSARLGRIPLAPNSAELLFSSFYGTVAHMHSCTQPRTPMHAY